MKKFYLLCALCALLLIPNIGKATVLLNEHFNQTTSTLATNENASTIGSDWTNITGSGQVYMSSNNLSYTGYKSTADETGGSVEYKATYGKKVAKSFTSKNSGSIYAAAIVKVSSCGASSVSNSRNYLWTFCDATSTNVGTVGYHFGMLRVQKTDTKFQFGVAKNNENALCLSYTDELEYDTPYLVVLEYKFVDGSANDIVYLYVNPTKGDKPEATIQTKQSALRPSDNAEVGAGTKADPSSLVSFVFNNTSSGTSGSKWNCLIDELKVVTDWADLWETGDEPGEGGDPEPDPITKPEPAASDVTASSATISWDAVDDADSYILQWKKSGNSYSDNIEIDKDERSFDLSALDENTKYYVKVKTIIDEEASAWAEINFTTDAESATINYKGITFNKYATTNAMPTSGSYFLAKNALFESDVTLTGDLNLCLHGRTLMPYGACIIVPDGVTFTIYDDQIGGQILGGHVGTFANAGLITIEDGGTLIIGEGAVQNFTDAESDSYAIHNKGTLKISGAPSIIGEDASIYLGTGEVITLESGKPLTNTTEHRYSVNAAGQIITSGWRACMGDADPSDHFVSAKSGYPQVLSGRNELYLTYEATILLSENNDNASAIADAVDNGTTDYLLVDRVFTDAQYNTVCLPFALNNTQLEYIFGSGYDLREFSSSSLNDDVLELNFTSRTALEAGKPYLIKPSQPVEDILRNGISVTTKEPVDNTEDTYISFHGTFSPTELEGGNKNVLFLGAGNELFWPETTGNLKGFRAYFEVKGAAQKATRARISKKEDHTTDIGDVRSENANAVRSEKILQNGQLFIIRDGKTYNVLGIECK